MEQTDMQAQYCDLLRRMHTYTNTLICIQKHSDYQQALNGLLKINIIVNNTYKL